ncbi:MAG TPA: SMI1/KNR4 family protein [Polyangiaceae bacterium]|nr:SMI1/KNR4 family protein [Polyangiaceae bacterium]
MADQDALLDRIRVTHSEILRLAPFRDMGLVPNPGASKAKIKKAEERLGRPLPPSYRAFLTRYDGWPRFFEGATLLGTALLGKPSYLELARSAFQAADTPVPDLGPPSRSQRLSIIPFGIDAQATTLFAFNVDVMSADGEYEVISWVNELGMRRSSFGEFLELVLELSEAELDAHVVQSSFGVEELLEHEVRGELLQKTA